MTNAAKPRSVISGDFHHASVRSVRCGDLRSGRREDAGAGAVGGGCAHGVSLDFGRDLSDWTLAECPAAGEIKRA